MRRQSLGSLRLPGSVQDNILLHPYPHRGPWAARCQCRVLPCLLSPSRGTGSQGVLPQATTAAGHRPLLSAGRVQRLLKPSPPPPPPPPLPHSAGLSEGNREPRQEGLRRGASPGASGTLPG